MSYIKGRASETEETLSPGEAATLNIERADNTRKYRVYLQFTKVFRISKNLLYQV